MILRQIAEIACGKYQIAKPFDQLQKVFEQFYRVEKSRSLRYGGSGLGLTIVKRIVELHGGTLEMESEPGAWTRVNITLPVPAKPLRKK